ncbi:DUF1674 domain-containing protein [Thalassospira sp.]|uniref:DUF1674 domain-containing protein n=1 Tax=Thalassospira sp. TaxID=1912094 RepID=UPI0027342EC6|nr:DUF1674 domain-containing protein [Thalassospira sp.]MDP2699089.1 DUF1674 domain-containing protein [Thalassospira sp.]
MAGKFRETIVQRPKAVPEDVRPAPEPAPELSQDAKNALAEAKAAKEEVERQREIGGPKGPEPTRFGDWEHKGRCIDF